jgi:ribosomal protein L13E
MRTEIAKPVIKRNFGYVVRNGRGYSLDEIKEAGLERRVAQRHGVPVDVWRKTKLAENVEQLRPVAKAISESPKSGKKAAKKAKKQEKS